MRLRALLSIGLGCLAVALSAQGQTPPDDFGPEGRPEQSDRETGPRGKGESPEKGEQAQAVLTPPELTGFVEARYPEQARREGVQAAVELEMVIDAAGKVSQASVLVPAGRGFDEAALEAVRQFVFKPATRDGQPVPSRIRYRYLFEIKPPEPPPAGRPVEAQAEEPPRSRLEGRVLDRDGEEPIAGVEAVISSEDGTVSLRAVTDDKGGFEVDELAPGSYFVNLFAANFRSMEQREELLPGQVTAVIYRLDRTRDPYAFSATARIPPPPREVTRRVIEKQQLTRVAGTRGDALRTVEILPGVARPPFGSGQLIVRGSSPQDTQALFEGLPIDLLYHFGGLTSFVHPRLLDSIEFFPGNFSARYGRSMGGIVEVRAADPQYDRIHGVADLNLVDASLLADLPVIKNDAGVVLAARRSYIDFLLENTFSDDTFDLVAAPVYYDYQAVGSARVSENDRLRLMAYGSEDRFALLFEQPPDGASEVTGALDLSLASHRAHATWSRRLGEDIDQDIDLAVGSLQLHFGLGEEIDFLFDYFQILGRAEWRARLSKRVRLIAGLDILSGPGEVSYQGPPPLQTEGGGGDRGGLTNQQVVEADQEFFLYYPACYLETDLDLDPLRVILGTRLDYYNVIEEWTFDPRISAHYKLTDQIKLKSGVGLYSQPPEGFEVSDELGNPELEPNRSVHLGGGLEYQPLEGLTLGTEGYFKYLFERVVGTDRGQEPFYVNDGIGRIFGVEFSATVQPRGRFFGYLSYTLSRSERRDRDDRWRLFDYDQPHILTASGTYRLGRGWEAGATFRLVSGNPDTPLTGGVLNLDTWDYYPVRGRINSVRSRMFHRLDVRVEKLWTFTDWRMALYLDVQNAYYAKNQEGVVYDFRYQQSVVLTGLPILPVLGLRGEI